MVLPALLYVTFLPRGTDIQGLGISAALASSASARRPGALLGGAIAFLGAWILFKTQLDNVEGMVRAITDILWTGSAARSRAGAAATCARSTTACWRSSSLWGIDRAAAGAADRAAARSAPTSPASSSSSRRCTCSTSTPACCREHVRPPLWRRAALVAMALFYGFFVSLSLRSLF